MGKVGEIKVKKYGIEWSKIADSFGLNWAVENEVSDFLYGFTRMVKPMNVLEIGTFIGVSAMGIGFGMKDNEFGKLLTVDVKDYGQEINIKKNKLEKQVECAYGDIVDVAKEKLQNKKGFYDFAFIDDGHEYEPCTRDLEICHSRIRRFGYILGHDILSIPTVEEAVNAFMLRHPNEYERTLISSANGIFILRKR